MLKLPDWIVIFSYFAFIIYLGIRQSRGSKNIGDFFLAGRRMRWWAIGLSVMATQASAITFISTPGQAYVDGMRFVQFYFGLPLAMVILCVTLVPFFKRAQVFTAYEYLERRFDLKTRALTSLLFMLSRGLADGVVMYAPAVILSALLGWDEQITILAMGVTTTFYIVVGGNRAVIWTDVVQMIIVWIGIFVCLGTVIAQFPEEVGLLGALRVAGASGKLKAVDLNPDPTIPYTFWSGLIGGFFLMMSYFGCDQSQVQRYLSGRSLAESRLSLLFNAAVKIPMQFLILLTGALVFVSYHFIKPPLIFQPTEYAALKRASAQDPALDLEKLYDEAWRERQLAALAVAEAASSDGNDLTERLRRAEESFQRVRNEAMRLVSERKGGAPFNDINYIFPTYVLNHLPAGIVGLVIAVIFAAAMSTISGELNSLATATVVDFYQRLWRRQASERHYLLVSRVATAFWGIFATVVGVYAGHLGSAIEVVNKIGSYFYGSILGVFLLALLFGRANGHGAFFGLLSGMASVYWVSNNTRVAFLYYNLIGCVVVIIVGAVVSLAFPAGRRGPAQDERIKGRNLTDRCCSL